MTTEQKSFRVSRGVYPDHALPPGELLREELEVRGISRREFANMVGLSLATVSSICAGRSGITARTALRIGDALEMSPDFWMNLQSRYELTVEYNRTRAREAS